jgi:hypothetical protein
MIRRQLDHYAHHAGTLRTQPEFRRRFFDYVRGTWSSISSVHAGMVQVALAQLASHAKPEDLDAVMGSLQGAEFDEFPNKTLAAAHDGGGGSATAGALGRRVEDLKAKLSGEKADKDAMETLARVRQKLLGSRWVRIGLAMGACQPLVSNRGKKAEEKVQSLRAACQSNWWLRLGEKLGSSHCRDLRRGE